MRTAPGIPTTLRLGLLPFAVLLAAALLAAGCGGAGETPPPSSTPSTVPTAAPQSQQSQPTNRPAPAIPDPLVAEPPAGTAVLPVERVDAAALPAGLPTFVWTRGDRTVGVYGRAGGCTDARLEVLEQDAERVVLRVVQFATGPGPCTRDVRYPPLEVTLTDPLDRRPVVLTGQVA